MSYKPPDSSRRLQFGNRKRSNEDTTRLSRETSRCSASVEVDQSFCFTVVDNSAATDQEMTLQYIESQVLVCISKRSHDEHEMFFEIDWSKEFGYSNIEERQLLWTTKQMCSFVCFVIKQLPRGYGKESGNVRYPNIMMRVMVN